MSTESMNHVIMYVRKVFGAKIPIVEAKENLRLQPKECDMVGADPLDPTNCLLVHTAQRMYDSRCAIFWKTTAYVDLMGRDGRVRVNRFMADSEARRKIRAYDKGELVIEGGSAIILRAPAPRDRLSAKRAEAKGRNKEAAGQKSNRIKNLRYKWRLAEKSVTQLERKHKKLQERDIPLSAKNKKLKAIRIAIDKQAKIREQKAVELEKIGRLPLGAFKRHGKPMKFDLTTRNGAAGNYVFGKL